ncbi:hypothetical protein T08_9883 [Trichinella sp. T8]|nr:hypothetical protein T08_9883 [Trichinella sp. T8]
MNDNDLAELVEEFLQTIQKAFINDKEEFVRFERFSHGSSEIRHYSVLLSQLPRLIGIRCTRRVWFSYQWFSSMHSQSVVLIPVVFIFEPGVNMQIFISPQATPRAMPQAIFQKFSIFRKFSPRRSPGVA